MDKSYVSMEGKKCIVCGKEFDSGNILLDGRLKDSMERRTTTGWGLCEKHQKLYDEGYIALIVCDKEKSSTSGDRIQSEDAYRTGEVIHLKTELVKEVLNTEPKGEPAFFIDEQVANYIKRLAERSEPDGNSQENVGSTDVQEEEGTSEGDAPSV